MHNTRKMKITICIMGVIVSIILLAIFFSIAIKNGPITVDSPKYPVVIFSFMFGSLIGTVSVPTLISIINNVKKR